MEVVLQVGRVAAWSLPARDSEGRRPHKADGEGEGGYSAELVALLSFDRSTLADSLANAQEE